MFLWNKLEYTNFVLYKGLLCSVATVYSDIPCWTDYIYGSLHQGWQASTYILGVDAKFLALNFTFNSFFSV